MHYRFSVVGLGRVGRSMLDILCAAGHTPAWVVTSKTAPPGVLSYRTIPEHPGQTQIVFIAVPDASISKIAREMAQKWGGDCQGISFFHFSGLLTSEELSSLTSFGAEGASLHPLQSITTVDQARDLLRKSWFTIEGTQGCMKIAREIISSIGAPLVEITREEKIFYHLAAVMASNYLVTVLSLAQDIMSRTGLELKHLIPLVRGTISNVEVQGSSALTGPVARGDWSTVEAHLKGLSEHFPDIVETYRCLGKATAMILQQKWPWTSGLHTKMVDRDALADKVRMMKNRGMKVVFTNGCFDIIHTGHVSYLSKARTLGDCLVVGMNTDASVGRIKGPGRPINDQISRASVLAALDSVDYITLFEEDTPYELISRVVPDVLVKGGDWRSEDIVGADIVKFSGGEVCTIEFTPGYSTSDLIGKIQRG
ncbi:MAG: D-glycero-beta-D-manno-heptose 1-phosphate adenylyltransferase [Desulfomonilia bacterium]